MPDDYSNITLTEEETSSLSQVEDKPVSTSSDSNSEPSESTQSNNWEDYGVSEGFGEKSNLNEDSQNGDSEEQYEFQIGDETFGLDSVIEWKKDADNKSEWNKSNTQKAQAIARGGKLLNLIDNDESFKDYIKDYFDGSERDINKYGLDSEFGIDFDAKEEPETTEEVEDFGEQDPQYDSLVDRINALEGEKLERSISDRYDSIREENPNFFKSEEDNMDFLNYCYEKGVYGGGDIDMEASFKLWSYDKVMTEENRREQLYQNKMRNEGSTIGNSEIGAREVRSGDTPKNYNEISMENPEVSRYFNT